MNYYIDTEFLEGTQDIKIPFTNVVIGKTKPTIDLISIGIVAEDGREYYAISKEFNLKEAWNRFQIKEASSSKKYMGFDIEKVYWIRENVLKPIWKELMIKDKQFLVDTLDSNTDWLGNKKMSYKSFKTLINKYGKNNKQIAEEIKDFVTGDSLSIEKTKHYNVQYDNIQFYGYYCDYDWVAFCWLFGKMMDLPKGFPMYCKDLKQTLDEKVNNLNWLYLRDTWNNSRMSINTIGKGDSQETDRLATFDEKLKRLKELDEYPKQTNEHNALADAKWNKQLHEFLKIL
jgi:hypothetical protein